MRRLQPQTPRRRRQEGATIVESVLGIIVVLLVGMGIIQWALIYHAKVLLDYAALQGARAGAVRNAQPEAITAGVARAMLPLYLPPTNMAGVDQTVQEVADDLRKFARLRILNPTQEAFAAYGRTNASGQTYIPNMYLTARSSTIKPPAKINIQDANLLKIQITYGYELDVPIIDELLTSALQIPFVGDVVTPSGYSSFEQFLLSKGRLPMVATATVRMQSPAYLSRYVVSRSQLATP